MNKKLLYDVKKFIGKEIKYDNEFQEIIFRESGGMLLSIRGWGVIQNMFPMTEEGQKEAGDFQDAVGKFIQDAINEKLSKKIK